MEKICKNCFCSMKLFDKILVVQRQTSLFKFSGVRALANSSILSTTLNTSSEHGTISKSNHDRNAILSCEGKLVRGLCPFPVRRYSALCSHLTFDLQGKSFEIQQRRTYESPIKFGKQGTLEEGWLYVPTPTELSYEGLEYLHDVEGLPWWLTIMSATLLYRSIVIFPFAIWQYRVFARMELAQPRINELVEQMRRQLFLHAKEEQWSKAETEREYTKQVREIIFRSRFFSKCPPRVLTYVGFWQCAFWISTTTALGQMTGTYPYIFGTEMETDYLESLTNGGILWFTDLTQPDIALSILLGLTNLTLVELWSTRRGPFAATQARLQNMLRAVAVATFPLASLMPAAISLFWLSSSTIGLFQFLIFRITSVRRFVEIDQTPSEPKRPFRDIKQSLRTKYFRQKVF